MLSQRKTMIVGKRPAIHQGHAAPLIQILTWLFLAFSSLSIITHFATKKALSRPLTRYDFIQLAALVSLGSKSFGIACLTQYLQFLSVGQAAAFLCPAGQSIGNSQSELSEATVMQAWKVSRSANSPRQILTITGFVQWRDTLIAHGRGC